MRVCRVMFAVCGYCTVLYVGVNVVLITMTARMKGRFTFTVLSTCPVYFLETSPMHRPVALSNVAMQLYTSRGGIAFSISIVERRSVVCEYQDIPRTYQFTRAPAEKHSASAGESPLLPPLWSTSVMRWNNLLSTSPQDRLVDEWICPLVHQSALIVALCVASHTATTRSICESLSLSTLALSTGSSCPLLSTTPAI